MPTLAVWLCAQWFKEVFYIIENCLIANKKQEVGVNHAGYLRNIDLIYYGVNSIILYKLQYFSIYLFLRGDGFISSLIYFKNNLSFKNQQSVDIYFSLGRIFMSCTICWSSF